MKNRMWWLVALSVVAVVVGPAMASAQDMVIADVPVKFMAAGKAHDPGKYELRATEDLMAVELVPPAGPAEPMLTITRLAGHEESAAEGRLVFDKVGETYYLSELWIPGSDGFLLHATKGTHTHHTIKIHKKAR
jgi:hypothetical protein